MKNPIESMWNSKKIKLESNTVLIFTLLVLSLYSCKKDTSPLDSPILSLQTENTGVTEAWLNLEVKNVEAENHVTVVRDDSAIYHISDFSGNRSVYDSGLLPGQTYTYKAVFESGYHSLTAEQSLTTMDTTSHDFSWELFAFGEVSSNMLNDCAIINRDNIWCVGEIYTNDSYTYDSLGNWIEPYSAVHWDGKSWKLMRIRQKLSNWKESHWIKIDGIFAFSENDIWFANGIVHHYNPSTYNQKGYVDSYYFKEMGVLNEEDGGITRLWGSSSENLYGGGWDGAMVHFDGETWQRIESGTTLTIRDIWGALIPGTDKYEVLSVASDPNFQTDQNLIQITNLSATFISDYNIAYPYIYDTVWFVPNYKYFLAGSGIYEKIKLSDQIWRRQPRDISNYYIHFIRGTELNNIVAVGGYGEILHFNGVSWKSYREITGLSSGNYKSVNIKDDLIVAVGYNNRKGVVAIGRR